MINEQLPPPGPGMFVLDGWPGLKWRAECFEEPWNGWAAPVVTGGVLKKLIGDISESGYRPCTLRSDGVLVVHREEGDYEVGPDADGLYRLAELGWTFDLVD